ncbi:Laccase-2 [Cladobotryum mycophilum]|uniref:Laccase-2 n=1 Tax=Cladobotryum mycophilum TaxID=491253 RepID=A0ABR0T4C7_9HYPO
MLFSHISLAFLWYSAAFAEPSSGQSTGNLLSNDIKRGYCENSPSNRSCWGYYDTSTNYYTQIPDTGRTVEYWLEITNTTAAPDGVERMVLAVNGSVPGPTISANWGDTVKIHVRNGLQNNGSAIHWHGIHQNYTNQMDGVPSITQCPIAPGESYTYVWRAAQYGTGWYHSHIGLQAWEGVFGGVVIHGPATGNYDKDLGVLFLNDWSHQTADELYTYAMTQGAPTMDTGLINGTNVYNNGGSRFQTEFEAGKTYLIRLINGAIDSHFKFSIDHHTVTIIGMDYVPIFPFTTNYVSIGMGQRYDILVTANQPAANYWMRAIPQKTCSDNENANNIKGMVRYGPSSANPTSSPHLMPDDCDDMPMSDLVPYLTFKVGGQSSDELLPVAITMSDKVFKWTIKGSSMRAEWSDPTLLQIYNNETTWMTSENVVELGNGNVWAYFVIQNTNIIPHPIHLHGHDFYLLAQETGVFNSAFSRLSTTNPLDAM